MVSRRYVVTVMRPDPPSSLSLSLSLSLPYAHSPSHGSLALILLLSRPQRLPPGFPVKFNIPVVPTVYAVLTFKDADVTPPSAILLTVPEGYKQMVKKTADAVTG